MVMPSNPHAAQPSLRMQLVEEDGVGDVLRRGQHERGLPPAAAELSDDEFERRRCTALHRELLQNADAGHRAVDPLAGVGLWGRPHVIGDPFKYYGWEGYHWIELNE